jgi:drug/metabolite transporter (DMT)-like permease
MGPLFSVGIACALAAVGLVLAYAVARYWLQPVNAFRAAALFIAGAAGGTVLGVFAAVPIVGVGTIFTRSWQVLVYLGWLGLAAAGAGALLVFRYGRRF